MRTPKLSVVMPVRNAMPYLVPAVQSILSQTFSDFEFIVGDDGSSDGSRECLREFAQSDARIRVLESDVRHGPVGSSNWVASHARANIVARMDADDISHPTRLQRQAEALSAHPEAVLVGSIFDSIDAAGNVVLERNRSLLLKAGVPPIAHGSIMYRREAFQRVGGYRVGSEYFEDVDLYCRLATCGTILVTADALFRFRFAGGHARLKDDQDLVEARMDRYYSHWRWQEGPNPTLVDDVRNQAHGQRLSPGVFVAIGSLRLWSGHTPGVLLRMIKRMRLWPLRESVPPLLWAFFGSLSPTLTRTLLRARARWRNRRAAAVIRDGHIYQWRHGSAPVSLGMLPSPNSAATQAHQHAGVGGAPPHCAGQSSGVTAHLRAGGPA